MKSARCSDIPQIGFHASAHLIETAVGFRPSFASDPVEWNKLNLFTWKGRCGDAFFSALDDLMIVYHAGGAPTVSAQVGEQASRQTHPGLLTIVPPGTSIAWAINGEVDSRSLHISNDILESLGSQLETEFKIPFACGFRDPWITAVIEALEREIRNPSEIGRLYADSVSDALVLHVLAVHSGYKFRKSEGKGLANSTLRNALDRLHESISDGISLDVLAKEAGLSRSHFINSFRDSMGVPPHKYLTQIRLQLACELLAKTQSPIADIALQCGFSSQAHLTTCFSAAYGLSPRRFRHQH